MRLQVSRILFVLALGLIVVRLFYWQIVKGEDLMARAEQQHLSSQSIEAPRGRIYSADGAILASNQPIFLLYGLPKVISQPAELATNLARILAKMQSHKDMTIKERIGLELNLKADILAKLTSDLYWVILGKDINFEVKNEIESLKADGLGFEMGTKRYYPEGSAAAHLLGFVGSDLLGRQTGYAGVEGYYNGELRGQSGLLKEEQDARGLPILIGNFWQREPKNGHDLVLNIDRTIQHIVEKKLKAGIERYQAKSASVLVMDPKTGAILAMASYPNFNPNSYAEFAKEYFSNPIVASSYEPGSTFKVLVMAAALSEGVIDEKTICDICQGPVQIGQHTIRTWNNKYYPNSTMTDVIAHSDNTGMVYVARKLGLETLLRYFSDFGIGQITQVDIQDEISPEIRPVNEWREIDLATASFGQGIAVTPIQLVRAVAAVANGGYLMEPQMVKEVISEGKSTAIKPKVIGRPISEEAAKKMTKIMVNAVEQGEAKRMVPKGYQVAGKTGTAQIPVAGHYDPNKTVASFIGFAPAFDPRFVMLVKYEEPTTSIYGAETAVPTFFEITKEVLLYLNVPPS